jgi:bifunctional UDP-N-acetylglucosamine pyrophosphorylase/glucosamine-1-phosphate N-acetyltransferase
LTRLQELPDAEITVVTSEASQREISAEVERVCPTAKVVVQQGDGQSGAVFSALQDISQGEVLIVNMNDVFEDTLLSAFVQQRSDLLKLKRHMLTGYRVDNYFPGGYLSINDAGNVEDVKEKPGAGNEPSDYVRIVFDYFWDVAELKSALASAASSKDDVYEVALSGMMRSGQVFQMLPYEGKWQTLKYPWHLLEMMEYFLSTIAVPQISAEAVVDENATIKGNVIIEAGVKVMTGAVINGPAYIGKNTVVGNNALIRNSMVGENCVIGFATEVARSYLRDAVWCHMNYLGDSIVDSNVSFGSTTVTANLRLDEGEIPVGIKGERISSGRQKLGAIIGANCRFGVGVNIMPGVKVGAGSAIAPGIVLAQDVENESYVNGVWSIEVKKNRLDLGTIDRDKFKSIIK